MSAQVTSMEPFEAFYHPRFGVVVLFRATTEPSVRDYVMFRLRCDEQGAAASIDGFLTGFGKRGSDVEMSS